MSLQQNMKCATLSECLDSQPLVPIVKLRNTYLASISSLLYIFVMGMVTSYSAPATVDMKKPGSRFRDVTANEITWIASLPLFSGVFGNGLSGYLIQKFGRKAVMMTASFSFVTSWLIIAYSDTIETIYVGRLISGFCAGVTCVAVPAYIVEIAPTEIRGLLSAGFQVAFTLGVFAVMVLGLFLRWSWLAISGAALVTCAACLMFIMPESPPWLVRNSKASEALVGLKFLRGKNSDLKKELQEITDNLSQQGSGVTWSEFRDPAFYKPVLISISLMFFQQFSGINAIMSYTVEIFEDTGSSVHPNVAAVVIAGVQVTGTAVSGVLMDKLGRRWLFITSASFMTLALLTLGLYTYLPQKHIYDLHAHGWIPIVSFVGYIVFFSLGLGPIPYVMTPELVPIHSRSTVIAIASVCCSFFAFIVTKVFDDMRTLLGIYGVFWTYGFFTLVSAIFGYFFVPETKGLTIRQISRNFSIPNGSV